MGQLEETRQLVNGQSGGMGCLRAWGSRTGWSTQEERGVQEGWGVPSPSCSLGEGCRAAERQRLWLQSREGVNWIQYPPSLLNSLINFLCSYFFLSLSSSLSCRLIKNSLSLKVFCVKTAQLPAGCQAVNIHGI